MNRSDAEILWEVASVLARDAAKVSRASLPPLLFFTDPERTPRPWAVAERLPVGSGVVYRAFGAPDARETALRLREATRRRNGLLFIGLDAYLADTCEADGVHLPERALDQAAGLRALRPDWRLTGAAHDAGALAECDGLDAAILSPVFPAGGASALRPALGLTAFHKLVGAAPCRVFALGGVNARTAPGLIGSGACGIAGVEAIRSAFGPD